MIGPVAIPVPEEAEAQDPGYIPFTTYDPISGRVAGIGDAPATSLERGIPGLAHLLGVKLDQATEYVDPTTGERVERPVLTVTIDKATIQADGTDTATITGIPAGATIVVRGETFITDGEPIEYSTVQPGLHQVRVDAFPARDEVVTIHAH